MFNVTLPAMSYIRRFTNWMRDCIWRTIVFYPDDEPFHRKVTKDGFEAAAKLDAHPVAFEQPRQLLPAPAVAPQVFERSP